MIRGICLLCVLLSTSILGVSCARPSAPTAVPTQAVTRIAQAQTAAPTHTSMPPTATLPAPTSTLVPPTSTPLPPTPTSIPPTTTPIPPSATPRPTDTAQPSPTPTQALPENPDPATGKRLWPQLPCSGCHGPAAEGDFGPRLAGTGLSYDQVLARVRLGKGQMPAFSTAQVNDNAVRHVHAWLRSMASPPPMPIAPPSFPTKALTELWYFTNEMRIRADFAKDLPVRVAQDDAGRLKVLKDYANDGLAQAQQVLDRANQVLNEVPNEGVKAIVREVIQETNAVKDYLNQALAQGSYGQAWPLVAEAVRICRLDTLPWATQAVRDAGLTGTVRLRVVDQSGQPIAGALATALTAHTPLGARADGAGRVTFINIAAVPALPVKAYAEGRVYHEINMNLVPGATVEGTIALPPLPGPGLAPAVANAEITPNAGSGNATVTLAVTVTDPQGWLDLAEDQIFALNPDLGLAYVLPHIGNDRYRSQIALPNLPLGVHTWIFFAVDHECNTSNMITVRYTVK